MSGGGGGRGGTGIGRGARGGGAGRGAGRGEAGSLRVKSIYQGHHCTGKTGKMAEKIPCQGKNREFGNFAKTQGFMFAQVVNPLILKVKDILIFAVKISFFFLFKLDKAVLCM